MIYLRSIKGTLIRAVIEKSAFEVVNRHSVDAIDKKIKVGFAIVIEGDRFDCLGDVIAYGESSVLVVTGDLTGAPLDLDVPHNAIV